MAKQVALYVLLVSVAIAGITTAPPLTIVILVFFGFKIYELVYLRHQGFGFCQNPFVIRTHMHIRSGPNMCTIVHIHCFCSGVAWHIFRDDRIPTIFVPQQRIKTRKCDYVAHPNAT